MVHQKEVWGNLMPLRNVTQKCSQHISWVFSFLLPRIVNLLALLPEFDLPGSTFSPTMISASIFFPLSPLRLFFHIIFLVDIQTLTMGENWMYFSRFELWFDWLKWSSRLMRWATFNGKIMKWIRFVLQEASRDNESQPRTWKTQCY